ncbi:hypothetical protein BaRGS_00017719 [Batillaria attramentaria]|uniref:Intimal thickness related receptor IRP domain-containing protein n=1 Tax=Batillaria attramentaria TaxID=370345 RepID=A0ABD0KV89_9CAEN
MRSLLFCFLGTLFVLSDEVEGRWVQGNIETEQTKSNWEFIARFCFLSQFGSLLYEFEYPVDYGTQEVLLYYDEPGQWESVYKSSKNCSERRSVLSVLNNQIIALNTSNTATSRYSGCMLTSVNGQSYYRCTGGRTFRSMRERWWYIVVARCDDSASAVSGLSLSYKLHMTNGEKWDLLHYEYSADEFYILPEDIAYLIAYLVMVVLSVVCAVVLRSRQLFHSTYKLYMVSLILWFFGLLLMSIAWGLYGDSGWQEKDTEVTGRISQAASTIIFILMLILMAKGYSITRGRLPQPSTIKIIVFFVLFVIVYITLFIWEGLFFDEGFVLYFYESPPGYGLITMRLIGWLWFLYAVFFTLKHNSNKANFYFPFFIFYTLWFWAGPVVILVAMFSMAKWSREKTVNAVEQFVGLCGHLFFLVLTRPSAANKNFPYHVRTSQIGAIGGPEEESQSAGAYRMEAYPAREGVPNGTGPDLASLFVVQRTDKAGPDENMNRGGRTGNGGSTSATSLPPSYSTIALPSHGERQAPNSTLPPLRGSSLPPIRGVPPVFGPSAPPPEEEPVGPPPAYDAMFTVERHRAK